MDTKMLVEALLFARGEPIAAEALAELIEKTPEEVTAAIEMLRSDYSQRGFAIIEKDSMYELGSRPECGPYLEKLLKEDMSEKLSRSALETVAIIAYKGPVSRQEIEFIRGVNSSFSVRNLLMRGLIERVEHPHDARSHKYRISFKFLEHMGISRLEELPEYETLNAKQIETVADIPVSAPEEGGENTPEV